jgi:hypothetical protein
MLSLMHLELKEIDTTSFSHLEGVVEKIILSASALGLMAAT